MRKASNQGAIDRAVFIGEVKDMTVKQSILALESIDGLRFPVVIIDKWLNLAYNKHMTVYKLFEEEFKKDDPKQGLHEKNQRSIQDVFGVKK